MTHGLAVVIGMSIAYIASFAGLIFAYLYYRKYKVARSADQTDTVPQMKKTLRETSAGRGIAVAKRKSKAKKAKAKSQAKSEARA